MQKVWKSVKIWQSYREYKGGNFFETQCSLSAHGKIGNFIIIIIRHYNFQAFANISGNFPKISGIIKFPENLQPYWVVGTV